MLSDCAITFVKLHVTELALPEIFKSTVGAVTIRIPMSGPLPPRDDDH